MQKLYLQKITNFNSINKIIPKTWFNMISPLFFFFTLFQMNARNGDASNGDKASQTREKRLIFFKWAEKRESTWLRVFVGVTRKKKVK